MIELADLKRQIDPLVAELATRARATRKLDAIYEGNSPLPRSVVEARVTKAYRMLMPMAQAPWASLVVDSVQDRLKIVGIRSGDDEGDRAIWDAWQRNRMDSESELAHNSALTAGRTFALVWPDSAGRPQIQLDSAEQMVVAYRPSSRHDRTAALRHWVADDIPHVTLYRPDGIYKFAGPRGTTLAAGIDWQPREVPDERWPLDNPFGVVPVVEIAVNRRLQAGIFGHARGEFAHCLGLLDRINLLTFLGLVVAFWLGFPLRGVIGERILRDDDGQELPPFRVGADSVAQFENPDAKIFEYTAADRRNLSVFAELDQLATVTKTPRHYFPLEQGMSNLSADAIRASEGGLIAKMLTHKRTLSDGWLEIQRLCGMMLESPIELSPQAEIIWSDHESRSLAERADAAVKLAPILPWQATAERVLNATAAEIDRWNAMRGSDAYSQLLAGALTPAGPNAGP